MESHYLERRCIDCKHHFVPQYGFETRCFGCWSNHQAEERHRLVLPEKRCKNCGITFTPSEDWEKACWMCRKEWNDQKLKAQLARIRRLQARKKARQKAVLHRKNLALLGLSRRKED